MRCTSVPIRYINYVFTQISRVSGLKENYLLTIGNKVKMLQRASTKADLHNPLLSSDVACQSEAVKSTFCG